MNNVACRLSYLSRTPLGDFQSGFGGQRATAITAVAIRAYCEFRLSEKTPHPRLRTKPHPAHETCARCRPVAPATVNRELALLKRMLRLGVADGLVHRVPKIEMLEEASPRAGFFEDHQYDAVASRLPLDLQTAIAVMHTYGWRKGEVLTLERRQLDLKVGTLSLDPGSTKNDEGRIVYLTPELKTLLGAQVARVEGLERKLGRIVPALFPHLKGTRAGKARNDFRKAWVTACKGAGVAGRLRHDFRRTAVRNMERSGVPRSVAMKLTGHKTESVYRRYAIVSDSDLRDAALRISARGILLGIPASSGERGDA